MNAALEIEQLLIVRDSRGPRVTAKSDVSFDVEEWALKTAAAYGDAEFAGTAVFALPVNAKLVAVATVVDNRSLRFLFVTRDAYRWIHDPFLIADRFPVKESATLSTLHWPDEPLPVRTISQLQSLLKNGDGPLLLGGVQALLDGVTLRLPRSKPTPQVRELWALLPDATRRERWPAEYCPSTGLPFHLAATPEAKTGPGIIDEEQAKDYPPGRYELALQAAVESGDEPALRKLLERRSPAEMMRLALMMLAVAVLVLVGLKFL